MGYKEGAIREFERHSRLGFVSEEGFMAECDRLRKLGFLKSCIQRNMSMKMRHVFD